MSHQGPQRRGPKFFVIAGEASGDALGAALMEGLRHLAPEVRFDGVGGRGMDAQGLASRFLMEELSVMGLVEVLPRYLALKRRIAQCAAWVLETAPDALITIDSPDFCLRVAKAVRAQGGRMPVIHYVAPSVWAWRPGRAAKMARSVDHVLALLPFEPPYMEAAGMSCDFVGHPIAAAPAPDPGEVAALRARFGPGPLLCLLPGSRAGEVARLGPVFVDALLRLDPQPRVVIPAAPGREEALETLAARLDCAQVIASSMAIDRQTLYAACDGALAASGTVTLELAAAGCPMVVGYDVHPVTLAIMTRLAKIDTITLVNIVTESRTIPEFIGRDCRPERIAPALAQLLRGETRLAQDQAMAATMVALGRGGDAPGLRAARSVLSVLDRGGAVLR